MSVPTDLVFLDLTPTEYRLLLFLLTKGRKGRWKALGRTTLDNSIAVRLDLSRQEALQGPPGAVQARVWSAGTSTRATRKRWASWYAARG